VIDPENCTNFDSRQSELEEFILFAIAVAGKSANSTVKALQRFLHLEEGKTPFVRVRKMIAKGELTENLLHARTGNYTKITRAYKELINAHFNLKTVTPDQLETVHGIGPKTSRFFCLHTQKDVRYAVLDTHILKWLRSRGIDAPKSTPIGETYAALERAFLREADKLKIEPAILDLSIWNSYHDGGK